MEPSQPVAVDHCTMFPDGNYGEACCLPHDDAFAAGGNIIDFIVSNVDLGACVALVSEFWPLGLLMAAGTTLFGWPFWAKPARERRRQQQSSTTTTGASSALFHARSFPMDLAAFFNAIRTKPFGGHLSQDAVDGIKAILPAWEAYGDGDKRKLSYILATAFHEADRFRTMREYASGEAYEGRRDLGNTVKGDGRRYRGRGFVQVTGRRNYSDWSARLGLDLIGDPDLAEQRPIAARILVQGMMLGTFTGKGLPDYIGDRADYVNARRTVNGTDRADLIAGYARQFEAALDAAGEVVASDPIIIVSQPSEPAMPPAPQPIPPATDKPLSPVEQSGKAVGAGSWTAVAGALWTVLVGLDVLPREVNTPEVATAVLTVVSAVAAAIGAYRAKDKRLSAS